MEMYNGKCGSFLGLITAPLTCWRLSNRIGRMQHATEKIPTIITFALPSIAPTS
jgi:hypothetical protein